MYFVCFRTLPSGSHCVYHFSTFFSILLFFTWFITFGWVFSLTLLIEWNSWHNKVQPRFPWAKNMNNNQMVFHSSCIFEIRLHNCFESFWRGSWNSWSRNLLQFRLHILESYDKIRLERRLIHLKFPQEWNHDRCPRFYINEKTIFQTASKKDEIKRI